MLALFTASEKKKDLEGMTIQSSVVCKLGLILVPRHSSVPEHKKAEWLAELVYINI